MSALWSLEDVTRAFLLHGAPEGSPSPNLTSMASLHAVRLLLDRTESAFARAEEQLAQRETQFLRSVDRGGLAPWRHQLRLRVAGLRRRWRRGKGILRGWLAYSFGSRPSALPELINKWRERARGRSDRRRSFP